MRLDSLFFSLGVQNECGKDEGNKGREKRMEPRIVSVCVCVRSSALLGDRQGRAPFKRHQDHSCRRLSCGKMQLALAFVLLEPHERGKCGIALAHAVPAAST